MCIGKRIGVQVQIGGDEGRLWVRQACVEVDAEGLMSSIRVAKNGAASQVEMAGGGGVDADQKLPISARYWDRNALDR